MSKNTKWILLFALCVVTYAASQHFEQQKGNEFKSPLLNFLPEQLTSIKIHESGKVAFKLLRNKKGWLLSANNIHEQAEVKTVEQLIKLLKTIRTTEITSQQEKDWDDYKLTNEQGTLICLETSKQTLPCVRFGAIRFSSEDNRLKAFARLDNDKEIFALNGFSISQLNSNFNAYRNRQIIKINTPIETIRFSKDSFFLSVSKQGNQWVDDELKLRDSLRWENQSVRLVNIQLSSFADELDELALVDKKLMTIQLFTNRDSFRLDCYMDSTFALPFILHSDQYPKTWMACDSVAFSNLFPSGVVFK